MKRKEQILSNLMDLYEYLYPHRELFKKNYFKFSPEEITQVISDMLSENNNNQNKKNRNVIRESITELKTEEDVRTFYQKHLQYNYDEQSRDEILKSYSMEELTYIYNILYSMPLRSKIRKNEIFNLIERYFESIDRALRMKP